MKLLGSDLLIIGASAIIIPTFSYLLYADFKAENRSGQEKQIGKISFVNNVVQRKYSAKVVWYDLDNGSPLYNKDSIRTEDRSEAVIVLSDGTTLEISESSMIYLDFSAQGINIDFNYGSIQAKRGTGGDGSKNALNIKSKDKVISINDGDLKLSKKENQDLSLIMRKGSAKINIGGKEQTLNSNEQALFSQDKVELKKIQFALNTPEENRRFINMEKVIPVTFSWNELRENKRVILEIAFDKSFTRKLLTIKTESSSFNTKLPKGIYYWRLSQNDPKSGRTSYSEVRHFTILQDTPLVLISPDPGRAFYYFDNPPIVNFNWSENSLASVYILELSQEKTFGKIFKTINSQVTSVALTSLNLGKYYWRVRTATDNSEITPQTSSIRQFEIMQKKELDPPNPVNPQNNREIMQFIFEKEGVVFNWMKDNEIKKTEIFIAADEAYKNIVYQASTAYNYAIVKKSMPQGKYFWRVRGETAKGEITKYSPSRSFQSIKLSKLSLLNPGNQSYFEYFSSKENGISFVWKRPETYGKFLLELSRKENFAPLVISRSVLSYSANIANLNPGTYFWRVALLGNDDRKLIISDARKFVIPRPLDKPVLLYPKAGSSVEMKDKNSLTFRWQGPKGANLYNVELFDATNWVQRKFSRNFKGSVFELKELNMLDVGKFYWTCKAFNMGNDGKAIQISERVQAYFNIKLSEEIKKPEIITPKTQFILDK